MPDVTGAVMDALDGLIGSVGGSAVGAPALAARAITVGPGVSAGRSLFNDVLIDPIQALPALAVSAALLAIGIAVGRQLLSIDGETELATTLTRVRRILTVVAFLACLGAFFAWVVRASGGGSAASLGLLALWSL